MMFWFNKKEIVVDCFTMYRSVYELYKPDHAMKFFPKDIKNIPQTYRTVEPNTKIEYEAATIRRCIGLLDNFKTGIIIPMWTDFMCQPKTASKGESSIGLVGQPYYFSSHPKEQYPGMFENHHHVKFAGPWLFSEKRGVKFAWNPSTWNHYQHWNNFTVLPAVISFNVQCQTNVNILINKNSDNFTLKAGTPLIHLTPLSEHKIKIKHHLVSHEEYLKIGVPEEYMVAVGNRRHTRWIKEKKEAQERESKKCPFGFGK